MSLSGLCALMTIPALTNAPVFQEFVNQVLVPNLRAGQTVILDNLPAHKRPSVRTSIEKAGCKLLFLRRYSPDFNPIEPCWSRMENELRTRAARTLRWKGQWQQRWSRSPRATPAAGSPIAAISSLPTDQQTALGRDRFQL